MRSSVAHKAAHSLGRMTGIMSVASGKHLKGEHRERVSEFEKKQENKCSALPPLPTLILTYP